MRKTILTLVLITLISGCTLPGAFQQLIPGFEQQEVKELPPDIVTVESLTVIPNPPINAEDQFSVSFLIKNQDDVNEAENVKYELFDYGLCTPPSSTSGGPSNYAPLQEDFVEWNFDAPDNDAIASLSTTCPIRFKIDYDFDARSQIDVNVISQSRLTELQRSGEGATFTPTLTVGRGPVKIYLSFGASLPVRTGGKLPLYVIVEDKGEGLYGDVPAQDLKIIIPSGFNITECILPASKFGQVGGEIVNKADLSLIRKKTTQLRCSLEAPSNVDFEKTFYITAKLHYGYTITGETNVAIEPTG